MGSFDNDNEQNLDEQKKNNWLVEQLTDLAAIKQYCSEEAVNHPKVSVQLYHSPQNCELIYVEGADMKKDFNAENLSESFKKTLCSK